jgi:glycosyltransferase involved in cell wall biosynthesis
LIGGKKIVVVMPAYNASKTLRATYEGIPKEFIDEILLVDDGSADDTVQLAETLGIRTIMHAQNKGYGANQKTCYKHALDMGADIIIMLHPDYQYSPTILPAMTTLLAYGPYDVVFGSRILTGGALRGGMPIYKYAFNRILTAIQNLAWGAKLSEYHTGFRGFKRHVLETINCELDSDDFVFDNQIVAQILMQGYQIGEISCPTIYFPEASSISLSRGFKYGLGVLRTTVDLVFARMGVHVASYLKPKGPLSGTPAKDHESEALGYAQA